MTEQKHTQRRWYVGKTSGCQGLVIAERDGANIAVTYDKADAPLVAAAPDLLEACECAVSSNPFMSGKAQISIDATAWDAIRAAIAKAKEGQPCG